MFNTKLNKEPVDTVLGVVIKANRKIAQDLRGDGKMSQALLELMEPEINKIKEKVREETIQQITQQVTQQITQQVTQQAIKNAIIALRICGNGDVEIKNTIMKAYGISDIEAEDYL